MALVRVFYLANPNAFIEGEELDFVPLVLELAFALSTELDEDEGFRQSFTSRSFRSPTGGVAEFLDLVQFVIATLKVKWIRLVTLIDQENEFTQRHRGQLLRGVVHLALMFARASCNGLLGNI